MLNMLKKGVMWYNNKLKEKPLLLSMTSAGIIFGTGDFIC